MGMGVSFICKDCNHEESFFTGIGMADFSLEAFFNGENKRDYNRILKMIENLKNSKEKYALVDLEDTFVIGEILRQNGWTLLTAINVMIFTIFHFPCMTTLLTIKKETGSLKWTAIAFLIPTICGIALCMLTTAIFRTLGTHHFIRIFLYWCYMGIFKISIIISIIYTNLSRL